MSMISGAGIVVATVLLGSASTVHATENDADGTRSRSGGIHRTLDDTASIMPPPRQAPVGHRQPRINDIPPGTQLSPLDLELKREDERIDRKLIICRGC